MVLGILDGFDEIDGASEREGEEDGREEGALVSPIFQDSSL